MKKATNFFDTNRIVCWTPFHGYNEELLPATGHGFHNYNPETCEGYGYFYNNGEPSYKFENTLEDGELHHYTCGFGEGDFWQKQW